MNPGDEKRAERARQLLDESVEHLDAATLSRLNQARQRALEAAAQHKRRGHGSWAFPASGLAAAFLAAVIWWPQSTMDPAPLPPVEDLEILVSADSLEMLEELEFFMWLDVADVDAG